MNSELMRKATAAGSAEELLAFAKENNVEMTEEGAKELFDRLHTSGELADDELDSVAGGCAYNAPLEACPKCGSKNFRIYNHINGLWQLTCYTCNECSHQWEVKGNYS